MRPIVIDPTKDDRWDQFVHRNPRGSIYHLSNWIRAVSSTYDYRPFCVVFEGRGVISSGIPFMRVDSLFTGKRIVSLPFTAYCQLLGEPGQLQQAIDCALHHHPDVSHVETRFLSQEPEDPDELRDISVYTVHMVDLSRRVDTLLAAFHRSTRRSIKKAEDGRIAMKFGTSEKDVETFYRLEVTVRKRLGLPPQPYRFFAQIWKELGPDGLVYLPMVTFQGKVIAAAMMLRFKDRVHCEYSASDPDYLQLRPNHKLFWETIQKARRDGAKWYDFGRTSNSNSGLLTFKDRWAAQRFSLKYVRYPETRKPRNLEGHWRRKVTRLNSFSPTALLRLQGEILYPHLG